LPSPSPPWLIVIVVVTLAILRVRRADMAVPVGGPGDQVRALATAQLDRLDDLVGEPEGHLNCRFLRFRNLQPETAQDSRRPADRQAGAAVGPKIDTRLLESAHGGRLIGRPLSHGARDLESEIPDRHYDAGRRPHDENG